MKTKEMFLRKVIFKIRQNKKIKAVLRRPVRAVRQCLTYSKAKRIYEKIESDIKKVNRDEKIIWYFCAPEHLNLGDLAQRLCIENWLAENYKAYKVVEIPVMGLMRFKNKVKSQIDEKLTQTDILIFQSGYTMSDYHPDDCVRKMILKQYKNNPCLIFPQTILYHDSQKLEAIKETLGQVNNLLLLARDEVSFEFAKTNFSNIRIKLYPDIVTTLIGKYSFEGRRSGIGMCIRNDGEKYYSDDQIYDLKRKLEEYGKVELTDTNCNNMGSINHETIEEEVLNKIKSLARYEVVITDRYHGTIFSLVAGTPIIVIKTNDHKVASGVEWFKGVYDEQVYYCASLEEVPTLVKEIINTKRRYKLEPYFKEAYYDKLKCEFENRKGRKEQM